MRDGTHKLLFDAAMSAITVNLDERLSNTTNLRSKP
jgi:hypothetical protein